MDLLNFELALNGRKSAVWIGLLLLAVNPLHIYYSQEVRMYGLALVFTIWSTGAFWQLVNQRSPWGSRAYLSYILSTTLGLYTLYYSALIPIAHLGYTLWQVYLRKTRPTRTAINLVVAQILIGLLYLPWVLYAVPRLTAYVADKIGADNDIPLSLPAYLGRHVMAFVLGHIPIDIATLEQAALIVGWVAIFLFAAWVSSRWKNLGWKNWGGISWKGNQKSVSANQAAAIPLPQESQQATPLAPLNPIPALWCLLLMPTILGFGLNLGLPFFPVGGERLLLMVLPYFLLLTAAGITALGRNSSTSSMPSTQPASSTRQWLRYGTLAALVCSAFVMLTLFYTTPRHTDRDYRGLVRHVVQNGRAEDRVLAIFPWQVGYWRAYAPSPTGRAGPEKFPTPILLGSETLDWNDEIRQQIDAEVATAGSLWFPAPLGLGSDLPTDIENYLREQASLSVAMADSPTGLVNFDAGWANPTTFLTGWRAINKPAIQPANIHYESLHVTGAGIGPTEVASANQLVSIQLALKSGEPSKLGLDGYGVSLRLEDESKRVWSQRDYVLGDYVLRPLPKEKNRHKNRETTKSHSENFCAFCVFVANSGFSQETHALDNYVLSEAGSTSNGAVENEMRTELTALNVPVGLPPGAYRVMLGFSAIEGDAPPTATGSAGATESTETTLSQSGQSGPQIDRERTWRPLMAQVQDVAGAAVGEIQQPFATIGMVTVQPPTEQLSPLMLPVDDPLSKPIIIDGMAFLGSSGLGHQSGTNEGFLAGTEIPLWLYVQNRASMNSSSNLYVSLLNQNGDGVAGWADWPLPDYPMSEWAKWALVQIPAGVQLPASVPSGEYSMVTGLIDPQTGEKSEPVSLGAVSIVQRQANFEAMPPAHPLASGNVRFGSHVVLLGYEFVLIDSGENQEPRQIAIRLQWHVQQSLLPGHHIFIHLVDPSDESQPLAQHDDIPKAAAMSNESMSNESVFIESVSTTPARGQIAPTGSWQAGEYLTTIHELTLPPDVWLDEEQGTLVRGEQRLPLKAGLYLPATGVRLPAFVDGQAMGDSALLE